MVRIAGTFERDGLQAFAVQLEEAGIVCRSWHFVDATRVELAVLPATSPRAVQAMTDMVRAAGARLL